MPKKSAPSLPIDRLRTVCLALPEAHEVEAWGAPTFRVKNKMFATFAAPENHHGAGRPSVWVKMAAPNGPPVPCSTFSRDTAIASRILSASVA